MHVMHILDYSPGFPGGIVDHLMALGDAFKKEQYHLSLGFPLQRPWFKSLSSRASLFEIPQIRHPIRSGFKRWLETVCRRERVDIVHLHFSFALALSLACSFRRWPIPTVYHWHNPPKALIPTLQPKTDPLARLKRAALALPARFGDQRAIFWHLAVSSEIRQMLIQNRWTAPQKALTLPNALTRVPGHVSKRVARGSTDLIIGSVANFRPQKDHSTLLKAFQIFVHHYPSSRLKLVGDGPTRTAVERLSADLGLADKVDFLGQLDDPAPLYEQFDIFALSTHYEGQGLVLLEAMSYSLPIVATDLPAIRETISNGIEGILVPRQDPVALSKAFLSLAEDMPLCQRLGTEARTKVLGKYGIKTWVNQLLCLYRAITGGSKSH